MAQPSTIFDVPGGQAVRIASQEILMGDGQVLVAEDIQWNKGFKTLDLSDADGIGRISAYSSTKGIGSMTVQLKTVTSTLKAGDNGQFVIANATTVPFRITSTSEVYTQTGAAKIRIEIAEWVSFSPIAQVFQGEGNLTVPFPCGNLRYSRPIPDDNGHVVIKQKFAQYRVNWFPQNLGTAPYFGGAYYLVEETELEDSGVAGVVTWDRVWATLPSSRQEPVSVAKDYQIAQYTWNGSGILDQGILGYTQTIRGTMNLDYFLYGFQMGNLPTKPTLMMARLFGSNVLSDAGTGFPTQQYYFNGSPVFTGYSSNYGNSFISGVIERYMGTIMVRKLIYG